VPYLGRTASNLPSRHANTVGEWLETGDPDAELNLSGFKVGYFATLPHRAKNVDVSDAGLHELPGIPRDAVNFIAQNNPLTHLPDEIFTHPTLESLGVEGHSFSPEERQRIENIVYADSYNGPTIILGKATHNVSLASSSMAPLRDYLKARDFSNEDVDAIVEVILKLQNHPDPSKRQPYTGFKPVDPEWLKEGAEVWAEIEPIHKSRVASLDEQRAVINLTEVGVAGPKKLTTVLNQREVSRLFELQDRRENLRGKWISPTAVRTGMTSGERALHSVAAQSSSTLYQALIADSAPRIQTAQSIYEQVQNILNQKCDPDNPNDLPTEENEAGLKFYPRLERGLEPVGDETAGEYLMRLTRCVDLYQLLNRYPELAGLLTPP
jgi:hypothetical protein